MTIFGPKSKETVKFYLPLGSSTWSIGSLASKGTYKNTALLAFSVHDEESIDLRRCFNDTTHIFAFGRNMRVSVITVTLICFLGECSGNSGLKDISSMKQKYENNRIYKKPNSMTIKIGSQLNMKGFLIGMDIGNVDATRGTGTVTFSFLPDSEV